eukprot:TRINITY_DN8190_c0_g1_i1.p1 TRINITY_DN8190_c0_g1~~TRINITY_DN8190_c0_g1_i1.p1  ORF type:complete len:525 (-),score=113.68 TRINITY_DN8190_c0_g1_i1:11-1585(-)
MLAGKILRRRLKTARISRFNSKYSNINKYPTMEEVKSVVNDRPKSLIEIPREFNLNPLEEKIFSYLKGVVRSKCNGTVLRVAGGWVRDKILGTESDDIDIAMNMMGYQFAQLLQEHMVEDGLLDADHHGPGLIKANPEQSKHLETATMQLFDVWLDFVNLRTEVYTGDNRIPEIQIGTAYEDALRRDLTINSLFYNINEDLVEDFTGRGIIDLKKGLIDTPLEPTKTFTDDPLRILRSIRFASRYEFSIDSRLATSIQSQEIKEHLGNKVSRERFGIEIWKMMKDSNPLFAIRNVCELSIASIIFSTPHPLDISLESQGLPLVEKLFQMQELNSLPHKEEWILATFLLPFQPYEYSDAKGRLYPVNQFVICSSLKLPNYINQKVITITNSSQSWREIIQTFERSNTLPSRLELGQLMRTTKDYWVHSLILGWLIDHNIGDYQSWVDIYDTVLRFSLEVPENSWNLSPIFSGKQLIAEIGINQGPAVGKALKLQMEWMLANGVTALNKEQHKEQCRTYLLSAMSE